MRVTSVKEILEIAAPLEPGFSIRVCNPPWRDLLISDLQQSGPNGSPTISVSYALEGRIIFPEMHFAIERFGVEMKMIPLSLRRAESEELECCAMEMYGEWMILPPLQQTQIEFAKVWDLCLMRKRYVGAFQK